MDLIKINFFYYTDIKINQALTYASLTYKIKPLRVGTDGREFFENFIFFYNLLFEQCCRNCYFLYKLEFFVVSFGIHVLQREKSRKIYVVKNERLI